MHTWRPMFKDTQIVPHHRCITCSHISSAVLTASLCCHGSRHAAVILPSLPDLSVPPWRLRTGIMIRNLVGGGQWPEEKHVSSSWAFPATWLARDFFSNTIALWSCSVSKHSELISASLRPFFLGALLFRATPWCPDPYLERRTCMSPMAPNVRATLWWHDLLGGGCSASCPGKILHAELLNRWSTLGQFSPTPHAVGSCRGLVGPPSAVRRFRDKSYCCQMLELAAFFSQAQARKDQWRSPGLSAVACIRQNRVPACWHASFLSPGEGRANASHFGGLNHNFRGFSHHFQGFSHYYREVCRCLGDWNKLPAGNLGHYDHAIYDSYNSQTTPSSTKPAPFDLCHYVFAVLTSYSLWESCFRRTTPYLMTYSWRFCCNYVGWGCGNCFQCAVLLS